MYKDSREVHILEVLNALPADRGIYMCTIHNSAGTAKTTAELEVDSKYSTTEKFCI
jgi:hypothetical protein